MGWGEEIAASNSSVGGRRRTAGKGGLGATPHHRGEVRWSQLWMHLNLQEGEGGRDLQHALSFPTIIIAVAFSRIEGVGPAEAAEETLKLAHRGGKEGKKVGKVLTTGSSSIPFPYSLSGAQLSLFPSTRSRSLPFPTFAHPPT